MQCEIIIRTASVGPSRCSHDGRMRIGLASYVCDQHYTMWREGKRMDLPADRIRQRPKGVCVCDGRIIVPVYVNDYVRQYAGGIDVPVRRLISSILEGWVVRQLEANSEPDPDPRNDPDPTG